MAAIKGTSMTLSVGGTALGLERSATLSMSLSDIDITNKGSSHQVERIAGNKDWSVDFEALFDDTDSVQDNLFSAYQNRTALSLSIAVGAETYTGSAYLSELSYEGAHDDAVVLSGTLVAKGALTKTG